MKGHRVVGVAFAFVLCVALLGGAFAQSPLPQSPQENQQGVESASASAVQPPPLEGGSAVAGGIESIEAAVGAAFNYQGLLKQGGAPVIGTCDMAFRLFDAAAGSNQVGSPITTTVSVVGGLFNVSLNFGTTAFEGEARWLEIRVRCPTGVGAFVTLAPRQPLLATPYALSLRPTATISATSSGNVLNLENYSATGRALYLRNSSDVSSATMRADNYGNSWAIYATTIGGIGIQAQSSFDTGVLGIHSAITGTAPGVHGRTDSQANSAVGVLGEVNTTSAGGSSAAVRGINESTTGSGIGVWGSQAGSGWGVYGQAPSGIGVYGWSNSGRGVYAASAGLGILNPALYAINSRTGTTEPSGIAIYAQNASGDATIVARNISNGDAYRSLSAAGSVVFAVRNNGRVWTSAVQIYGGGDLAEKFDVSTPDASEPGTLLVIDENNPGQLTVSTQAYDRKVAGVVSGANGVKPGLTLHQDGVLDGDTEVAIAGRVYVKADASYGAIKPGDLLTTSDTPGHAMKADDAARSPGAIVGKAMSALDEGTGLVLVLVNLQ